MSEARTWPLTADDGPAGPLWGSDDVVRWVGTSAVGLVLYAVAWYLASGQAHSAAQMGPVNLGVAGLVVFGVANAMWLMRGHRAVRSRARTSAVSPALPDPPQDRIGGISPGAVPIGSEGVLVAGEEGVHYHRLECPMIHGRDWSPNSRHAHEATGKRPCGICRP